jgi:hypothetical protein
MSERETPNRRPTSARDAFGHQETHESPASVAASTF